MRTLGLLIGFCLLAGCGTHAKVLELQKQRLERVERAAVIVKDKAIAKQYVPDSYDLYLFLGRTSFDTILASFSRTNTVLDLKGRKVVISVISVSMGFKPGSPEVEIKATARDEKSGIEVEVELDSRLVLEGGDNTPDAIKVRVVATRLVPKLSWGPVELTKYRLARDLLELEATKFTERIPVFTLPLRNDFSAGSEPRTQSITLPAGNSTISGNVSFPGIRVTGSLKVSEILFLKNGVHMFANIEGI